MLCFWNTGSILSSGELVQGIVNFSEYLARRCVVEKTYQAVVYHNTCIILKPQLDKSFLLDNHATPLFAEQIRIYGGPQFEKVHRVAAMMDLLAARGFEFRLEHQSIYAESTEVEAQEAENYLLSNGFDYSEFQVILEYTRMWGMM